MILNVLIMFGLGACLVVFIYKVGSEFSLSGKASWGVINFNIMREKALRIFDADHALVRLTQLKAT